MLIGLLVFAALGLYLTTREERARLLRLLAAAIGKSLDAFAVFRLRSDDPFYEALRERARWPLVTLALVAVNLGVVVAMIPEAGAIGEPDTLVAWGASVGPRTTNGERWRLFTSVFVHQGLLHALVNVAALAQLGCILERAVGRVTFVTVYITAGVLGAIASVAAAPLQVSAGATCAVWGVYGLLAATLLRGVLHSADVPIPLRALKTLAPGAVVFVLYYMAGGSTEMTSNIGLCTGLTGGIVLTRRVADGVVRLRRVAALTAATALILFLAAMAVRVVADVRPDIAAVVALEERTARLYDAAVTQFQDGRLTARGLAQVIDETIVPDLLQARARVSTLKDVPADDVPLLADTQEFLRLRHESWRMRADALRRVNARNLREADKTEHASLQVFHRVKTAVAQ